MNKQDFFSQPRIKIDEIKVDTAPYNVYVQQETKQVVYEIEINAGIKEPVEIGMVTDLHFNYANDIDKEDEEIMETIKYRMWLKNAESVPYAINALKGASLLDQIVVCGDSLDYLSNGTMELMKKHVFDVYPDSLCVLGGHELTKQMQTGKPNKLTLEERIKILEDFWLHDAHYYAKLVKNSVLCIGLDNSNNHYYKGTSEKLRKDIELARQKGYAILIFQHEPLNTGDEKHKALFPIWVGDPADLPDNMCDDRINIGLSNHNNQEDDLVCNLIKSSADVIKGIFTGHKHNLYYTEIPATDINGNNTAIPQAIITCNAYRYKDSLGQITRIFVK